jgi:uncharacterized damage-inducible protein DinB
MPEPFVISRARQQPRLTQKEFLDILGQANHGTLHHHASEGVWSLAEVLAHISEARTFFGHEAARLAAQPGSRVGRTVRHAGRLAAVRDHGHDSAEALRAALLSSHEELMTTLEKLSDDDLKTAGEHVNPKFGRVTLEDLLLHFVLEHDQNHVRQARRCLEAARQ